jgi:hypothetical protein
MRKYLLGLFLFSLLSLATASAPTNKITLQWDPSPSPSVTTYRLHFSNTPVNAGTGKFNGSDNVSVVSTVNTVTMNNLADGVYYFAVTAVDPSAESVYSNIVTSTLTAPIPPSPASNLRIIP